MGSLIRKFLNFRSLTLNARTRNGTARSSISGGEGEGSCSGTKLNARPAPRRNYICSLNILPSFLSYTFTSHRFSLSFSLFFLRHDRNTSGSMERYEQVRAVKVFHRGAPLPVVYDHDHDDEDDTPRREREIAVATEYKLIC